MTGHERRAMDDLTLRIDFHRGGRSLLGQQRVAAGQALAAQHLWTFAEVLPDGLLLAIDLDDAGRIAAKGVEHVPVGQRLKDYGQARRPMFPDDPAVGIELDQPVRRVVAVFEEHDPVFDRLIGVGPATGAGNQRHERQSQQAAKHCDSSWCTD